MRIRERLTIVFSVLIVSAIGITSLLTLRFIHTATITHELEAMHGKVQDIERSIQFLHDRATEDIVFALRYPIFVEYFSLPETMAGNKFRNGTIHFTQRQRELKRQLENWLFHFQSKFIVDEACLIDKAGQEHVRLFENNIEPDERLSSTEMREPFFSKSFERQAGEVHIEYPYLSSDTQRWVFAYTSPVVLKSGEKPAFFHFEMPLRIFQDLLPSDLGRMSVIDPGGYVIADTKIFFPTIDIRPDFPDYFPSVKVISESEEFGRLVERMKTEKQGDGAYEEGGEIYHVVFRRLKTFDWILAYIVPQSAMMSSGGFSVNDLQTAVFLVSAVVIIVTVFTIFLISSRLSNPIIKLRDAATKIAQGDFEGKIDLEGDDEIRDLERSFGSMAQSLRRTIELEKQLAASEQKTKDSKLTAMGSMSARLAHDIRNLLSTIKTTVDLIKSNAGDMGERAIEQHKRLDRAVEKMTFQVNSVMDFVRTNPLELNDHDILDIVESAMSEIEIPAGISIRKPEGGVRARCDKKNMEVVMANLIVNAIQAVGTEGEVIIRAKVMNDKCIIEVEDTGPGIPAEILPRIFEPLYTTKETGTGLGLLSCRSIIEQHDGTLKAFNNPTRFVIELPRA